MDRIRGNRQAIWINNLYMFALCLLPTFILSVLLAGLVGVWSACLFVPGVIIGLIVVYGALRKSKVDFGQKKIVLLNEDGYFELGMGPLYPGWFTKGNFLSYDARPRISVLSVRLPTSHVRMLVGSLSITWKPDENALPAFFDYTDPELHLNDRVATRVEAWAKTKRPDELYYEQPDIEVSVPGITVESLWLTALIPGDDSLRAIIPSGNMEKVRELVLAVSDVRELRVQRAAIQTANDIGDDDKKILDAMCDDIEAKFRSEIIK